MSLRKTAILCSLVALLSCENPFNPKGPYAESMIVYSIISNSRDSQYVRVYSTYDSDDANPSPTEPPVRGARVSIREGLTTFQLRETTLVSGGRPIQLYVSESLYPKHGSSYRLEVESDFLGTASSEITIPSAPVISFPARTSGELDHPIGKKLEISLALSPLTRMYLLRVFIEYETMEGANTVFHRWQLPEYASDICFSFFFYPSFKYAGKSAFEISFRDSVYIWSLARILYRYSGQVRFRAMVFEVIQIGEPLHTYTSVVGGFEDEFSLRTDKRDYTNITGGRGLFGAFTQDVITRPFPVDFLYVPPEEFFNPTRKCP